MKKLLLHTLETFFLIIDIVSSNIGYKKQYIIPYVVELDKQGFNAFSVYMSSPRILLTVGLYLKYDLK